MDQGEKTQALPRDRDLPGSKVLPVFLCGKYMPQWGGMVRVSDGVVDDRIYNDSHTLGGRNLRGHFSYSLGKAVTNGLKTG